MNQRDKYGLPVLYSFRRCPYAMRARLAILASGLGVELREVLLKEKPAELLACSPKGTVPVLVLAGTVLDESWEIMRWALQQHDPQGLLGHHAEFVQPAMVWQQRNDRHFKPILDRYKYFERHPALPQAAYLQQALPFLDELETALRANTFLLSDQPSIADLALWPFIRQFAMVDQASFDALPLPRLQGWLATFLQSRAFERIMLKTPPWQLDLSRVIFPAPAL